MKVRLDIILPLSLSILAISCANNVSKDATTAEVTKDISNLTDSIISIYPKFEMNSDFHNLTNRYPNCVEEKCGKPISFIANNDSYIKIYTVGNNYPSYQLSPGKKSVLIQDNHGAHAISPSKYLKSENDPEVYQDRGGAILDNGEAVALFHLGAIEVNGKSGFGTQLTKFSNSTSSKSRDLIDGTLIQCENNAFLISYGDEDINNSIKHSYEYNWNEKEFEDLNLPLNDTGSSIYMYDCNGSDSFQYIRTTWDGYMYGSWSKSKGFNDISPINIKDVRRPNGIHNYYFDKDGIYYLDDVGSIYFSSFTSITTDEIQSLNKIKSSINFQIPWSSTISNGYIYVIGRGSENHWTTLIYDLRSRDIVLEKQVPLLDQIYPTDEISDIRILDPEAALKWFKLLPDT